MIKVSVIEEAMYQAMKKAATALPPDVEHKLNEAYAEETDPLAKKHLEVSLENARLAGEGKGLVCGDTGFPLYFIRVGKDVQIENGFSSIRNAAQKATARATADAYLRPTMVDPLTRANPGDNIGPGMPKVELSFDDSVTGLEIIAAPKGGGSEIFGTFYKMMFPADGLAGIKKFIIECIKDSCYAGKICPPAIVGVGIGGTADLCVKMAKEAALLRPLNTQNSRADLAGLEQELLHASRELGIGPMGSQGINCVMGLHIETAVTHTAALPVAVNAQCLVGRRWQASISTENAVSYSGDITNWNHGV